MISRSHFGIIQPSNKYSKTLSQHCSISLKDTVREFEGSTKVVFPIPEVLTNLNLDEYDDSKFRPSFL